MDIWTKGMLRWTTDEDLGRMLLLPSDKLVPVLSLILTLLSIHSTDQTHTTDTTNHTSKTCIVPTGPIISTLHDDHDCPGGIIEGILDLFGSVDGERWTCDVTRVVGDIGNGLLQGVSGRIPLDEFMRRWKAEVGDMWSDLVDAQLLQVSIHNTSAGQHDIPCFAFDALTIQGRYLMDFRAIISLTILPRPQSYPSLPPLPISHSIPSLYIPLHGLQICS